MKNKVSKKKLTQEEKREISIKKYPFLYKKIEVPCVQENGVSVIKTVYKKKYFAYYFNFNFSIIYRLFYYC